jgi:hypothetical protein
MPPEALRVPVTAMPVEETAATVVPLLFKLRMPEASPVIEMPPAPLVRAEITEAIYISPKELPNVSRWKLLRLGHPVL